MCFFSPPDRPRLPLYFSAQAHSAPPRDYYAATALVDFLTLLYVALFYHVGVGGGLSRGCQGGLANSHTNPAFLTPSTYLTLPTPCHALTPPSLSPHVILPSCPYLLPW